MKERADALEAWEESKWAEERQAELAGRERVFKARLAAEAETVGNRLASRKAALARERETALETLLTRYENAKAEVARQHKAAAFRLAREVELEMHAVRSLTNKLAY
jgi:hypothetical protein